MLAIVIGHGLTKQHLEMMFVRTSLMTCISYLVFFALSYNYIYGTG